MGYVALNQRNRRRDEFSAEEGQLLAETLYSYSKTVDKTETDRFISKTNNWIRYHKNAPEIAYKWIWLLLPLPLLVFALLPPLRRRRTALIAPFFQRAAEVSGEKPGRPPGSPAKVSGCT